jgi:hypothetical protein
MAFARKFQFATSTNKSSEVLAVMAYDLVKLGDASRLFSGVSRIAFTDIFRCLRNVGDRSLASAKFRLGRVGPSSRVGTWRDDQISPGSLF